MSYDNSIWSVNKTSFENEFFNQENIKWENDGIIFNGGSWQIMISNPHEVMAEDIPEEVFGELPGISYFTELILEPIGAPKRAFQILKKISKILAQSSHGVIFDEQEGTISSPSGVKRLENVLVKEDPSFLQMTWWFIDDNTFKKTGFEALLNLIESTMPEAMPRRYGLYEPPQFKISDKGKEHFIEFISASLHEGVVWYPSKPFTDVHIGIPDKVGPTREGFRSCYISIDFLEEVMVQPGWPLEIKRFWLKTSELLNSFYGEVRRGWSPVSAWWWRGLPKKLGNAAILGKPYIDLWPDFVNKAKQTENGLFYIENIKQDYQDLHSIITEIPEDIVQPKNKQKHSRNWPFEGPFLKYK
ncbi:hypothetical protein V7127_25540 [Bacillus sp. JJ1773]|uniref:hypothetical protein n=1 Tax=Bacillus sp. JJ1773 TaxID=3122965 RepID=UPI002FFF0F2B